VSDNPRHKMLLRNEPVSNPARATQHPTAILPKGRRLLQGCPCNGKSFGLLTPAQSGKLSPTGQYFEGEIMNHTPKPWKAVANSWQHTTIYDANGKTVCTLDLEDWDVTEENQDELENQQAEVAAILSAAPEVLDALKVLKEYVSESLLPMIAKYGAKSGEAPWAADIVALNIIKEKVDSAIAKAESGV
jgi:hypothetical protein